MGEYRALTYHIIGTFLFSRFNARAANLRYNPTVTLIENFRVVYNDVGTTATKHRCQGSTKRTIPRARD